MNQPRAYEGMEPYIFISYAHKDSDTVLPIISALQERGFRVWYDAGIMAGTEWPEYIAERLNGCANFVAFISKHASASHNCRREINFAINLRKDPLVIYLEDDVNMTLGMQMQLDSLQAIYFRRHGSMESFVSELYSSQQLSACLGNRQEPTASGPKVNVNLNEYYRLGKECEERYELFEAIKWYRMAAEKGHPGAQCSLGKCYELSGNDTMALKWYQAAADQGDPDGYCQLGWCYERGIGVGRDHFEAMRIYRMIAAQGHAKAQLMLGECYRSGTGVEKDADEAVKWFTLAAEQGNAHGQYYMGEYYRDKANGTRDYRFEHFCGEVYVNGNEEYEIEAIKWYRKAAEQGHQRAKDAIGELCFDPEGIDFKGERYLTREDQTKAVMKYTADAMAGDAVAQCNLGACYQCGKGVHKDSQMAAEWFQKSANQGYARAQFLSGECYSFGFGVDEDEVEAEKWYRKSAEQGYIEAQYALGYFDESYSPEECIDRVKWCSLAAEQGDAEAQHDMYLYYSEGKGVKQNNHLALKWLKLSAAQGCCDARDALYSLYDPERMCDKADALFSKGKHSEALDAYKKAAELGNARACRNVGYCFERGISCHLSEKEAARWYQMAAEGDDAISQRRLGECYEQGKGVMQDHAAAFNWYSKAADQSEEVAQYLLGRCYEYGEGVTKNRDLAFRWYCKAAEPRAGKSRPFYISADEHCFGQYGVMENEHLREMLMIYRKAAEWGDATAQFQLGECYFRGLGIAQNNKEAFSWYRKAAEQGDEKAQFMLGECYKDGIGVMKSKMIARKWYRKAAEQGHEEAKKCLKAIGG